MSLLIDPLKLDLQFRPRLPQRRAAAAGLRQCVLVVEAARWILDISGCLLIVETGAHGERALNQGSAPGATNAAPYRATVRDSESSTADLRLGRCEVRIPRN